MRAALVLVLVLGTAGPSLAGESATVPWREFRQLYRESIEREIMKRLPAKRPRALHTLEEAVYQLRLGEKSASCRVLLSGKVLAGRPAPVALFSDEVVLARIESVKGGTLVSGKGGFSLLPDEKAQFQVSLSLLVPVREDRRSKHVAFAIPAALKNSLRVELPAGARLLAHPGIADREGLLHFSSAGRLELRFEEKRDGPAAPAADIDALTRARLEDGKLLLDTHFRPARPVAAPLTLRLPAGARYASSSLKSSWLGKAGKGALELRLPAGFAEPFSVRCVLDAPPGEESLTFRLPGIEASAGRGGYLILEEPDDAELSAAAKGLVAAVPVARLPAGLRALAGRAERCAQVPTGSELKLSVRRFWTVGALQVMADSVHFFTAFEEAGGNLSVLRVKLPAGAGPRLRLAAVPGAEIWSLKVNGKKRRVYGLGKDGWIVPLAREGESEVELAFLRKGKKLGLEGRLEALLPRTGLSARKLVFAVALPPRVELVSVEGELTPAREGPDSAPREFVGKRYYFARSFYKGGGLKAALHYREPVKTEERGKQP